MRCIEKLQKWINYTFSIIPRFCPSSEKARAVKLIAHRGAHDRQHKILENTLAAFDRALSIGCWGIELDIRMTQDGIWVVHHDPDLERLWGFSDRIDQLSYVQLHQKVPQIPTIVDVVRAYGKKLHLFIELKAPCYFNSDLLHCLKDLEPVQDYHFITLEETLFAQVKAPISDSLLLIPRIINRHYYCKLCLTKPYGGILAHYLMLTNQHIKALRNAGKQVGIGLIDSKYNLYREINRDIQWIFTDKAAQIADCLKKIQKNAE